MFSHFHTNGGGQMSFLIFVQRNQQTVSVSSPEHNEIHRTVKFAHNTVPRKWSCSICSVSTLDKKDKEKDRQRKTTTQYQNILHITKRELEWFLLRIIVVCFIKIVYVQLHTRYGFERRLAFGFLHHGKHITSFDIAPKWKQGWNCTMSK